MQDNSISESIQSNVQYIIKELGIDNENLSGLYNNLSNTNYQFYDIYPELCIAYALKRFNPQYEKGKEKRIDFSFRLNDRQVFIEVKNKNSTKNAEIFSDKYEKLEENIKEILGVCDKKYNCFLQIEGVDNTDDLEKLSKKLLCEIKKNLNKIAVGVEITSKINGIEGEILFKVHSESDSCMRYGSFSNQVKDHYTYYVLKDWLYGNGPNNKNWRSTFLSKFDNTNPEDIKIAIIVPTSRTSNSGDISRNFSIEIADAILENILEKKEENSPNQVIQPWYDEVKNKIDAVFMICNGLINTKRMVIKKYISRYVDEAKKKLIDEIYDECIENLMNNSVINFGFVEEANK